MSMWNKSKRLQGVGYDIRGVVLEEAEKLLSKGVEVLKLNIGNTAPFNLLPSLSLYKEMFSHQHETYGYGESRGILEARNAIKNYYEARSISLKLENIYLGNGVSELISIALQALLDRDDEVLIPSPDYPLWTATVTLCGAKAVHYLCDEDHEWNPSIQDIKSKINTHTRAIVIINPNNPTGAVYDKECLQEIVSIAQAHNLVIFSDEIYERVLYDGAEMHYMAQLTGDYPCIFFNGLSKSYRAPGLRVGWACVHDPLNTLKEYLVGFNILSNMRLCSNVLAQWAVPIALTQDNEIDTLVSQSGRLFNQRQLVLDMLEEIEGISVVRPKGAMYVFPKFDRKKFDLQDDEKMVLDLLHSKHVLLVHGRAFNYPEPDHVRIVFLPEISVLEAAMRAMKDFFADYRQV